MDSRKRPQKRTISSRDKQKQLGTHDQDAEPQENTASSNDAGSYLGQKQIKRKRRY
mgnify:CR=1 FL=1